MLRRDSGNFTKNFNSLLGSEEELEVENKISEKGDSKSLKRRLVKVLHSKIENLKQK